MNESETETKESEATNELVDYRRIEVVEPDMAAVLRSKTIAQRLEIVEQAHRMAKKVIAMGVRMQQPHLTSAEVDRAVARRLLSGTS